MADDKTKRLCKTVVQKVVKKMLFKSDEDIEQEIYIRLWEKFSLYKEENKLLAWVRTVAENYCRDYLKKKSRALLTVSVNNDEGEEEIVAPVFETPEALWIKKLRQKIILDAVNELPKEMKKTIILVEFKGLSYEEAAKALKISVGTVKSRLFNAKAKLHEKLSYLEL